MSLYNVLTYTLRVKKVVLLKLFAIFLLVVNLCNWLLIIAHTYSYVYTNFGTFI